MGACVAGVLTVEAAGLLAAAPRDSADAVTIVVPPQGNDSAAGTREHPFRTLQRAQQAVREANGQHDVVVQLVDGLYLIEQPLLFRTADGGQH